MAGEIRTHELFVPNEARPLTMVDVGHIRSGLSQRVVEAEEQALVQQLVAHPAIERLREPVLRRLAWRDVMPGDPLVLGPRQDGRGGERRASAASQYTWLVQLRRRWHTLRRSRFGVGYRLSISTTVQSAVTAT
jgi:hypothetical protein